MFEQPIQRGRDRGASPAEQAMGEERSQELARLTSVFVLRRTQAILDKYLPPKTELTVFCRLSLLQHRVYDHLVKHVSTRCLRGGSSSGGGGEPAQALTLINTLTSLCNHPDLIAHRLWAELARRLEADGGAGADGEGEGEGKILSVREAAQEVEKRASAGGMAASAAAGSSSSAGQASGGQTSTGKSVSSRKRARPELAVGGKGSKSGGRKAKRIRASSSSTSSSTGGSKGGRGAKAGDGHASDGSLDYEDMEAGGEEGEEGEEGEYGEDGEGGAAASDSDGLEIELSDSDNDDDEDEDE